MPQVPPDKLSQADCICPVCLEIFLEPVTLPCDHTFCKPCFQQTVDKSSLCCPICRKRVSTWARLHGRNKTLVNKELWERVQEAFPVHCQHRLSGRDLDDATLNALIPLPQLCKPGELRQEYEDQKSKLEAEKRVLEEEERRASEEFIQQLLVEEDGRRAEEWKRAVEVQLENDERLAQVLSKEIENISAALGRSVVIEDGILTLSPQEAGDFSEIPPEAAKKINASTSDKDRCVLVPTSTEESENSGLHPRHRSSQPDFRAGKTGDEDTCKRKNQREPDTQSKFKSKRLKVLPAEGDPHEGAELSVDGSHMQQLIELENEFFMKLQQEKKDRLLALQLQRQLNKEMKEVFLSSLYQSCQKAPSCDDALGPAYRWNKTVFRMKIPLFFPLKTVRVHMSFLGLGLVYPRCRVDLPAVLSSMELGLAASPLSSRPCQPHRPATSTTSTRFGHPHGFDGKKRKIFLRMTVLFPR
ncbi:RN168 ligase, partial [Polyodon spathula]|nr:RN168 ligase [Polyodon spathula]